MKIFKQFLAVCLLMTSVFAWAVPAQRIKRTITLADGTQKQVMLMGDENIHYYIDSENNAYVSDANGGFVKADCNKLETKWTERLARRNNRRIERAIKRGMMTAPRKEDLQGNSFRRRAQWGAESNPISGDKKGLVILVNFSNKSMNSVHNQEFYDGFFNAEGFSREGSHGSVHDYFYECSYGQFNLTFDVLGPVKISREMSYYGENDSDGNDKHPADLVTEACALANELGADFTKYDWDGDGKVDQVFLVYAGYGEHAGAPAYTIWPHESSLSDEQQYYGDGDGPVSYDGVTIDTYAVTSELDGNTGSTSSGIGVACHEFSHCMCLPDFYDTRNVSNRYYGMDSWDLMDCGSYSDNGNCPAPYTSYERMYCGWLTPTVLSDPCQITEMPALSSEPKAYIIYNDGKPNEYYMLENRQLVGFDSSSPNHGMLVLHVYFSSKEWSENTVNTKSVQRMTIIPADNILSHGTNSGDTWPGKTGKTALTDTSTPAATLYVANKDGRTFMGKPIENITESADGKISFTFAGGFSIDAPVASEATDIEAESFTANWAPVKGATGYKVQLTATDLEANEYSLSDVVLIQEDFHGFNNGKTADGSTDIGGQLDNYTSTKGWEGEKLYTSTNDEVKLGTRMNGGYIVTPWLTSESKQVTLSFTVRSYGSDTNPVELLFSEDESSDVIAEIQLTKEPQRYVYTVDVKSDSWWWGIACEGRCYISEMSAYDGVVTKEQIEAGVVSNVKTETYVVQTTGTSYLFTGLSNNKKYTYTVCTLTDEGFSKWSNEIEVMLLSDEDGINTIEHSPLNNDHSNSVVYDLSGRRISAQSSMSNGLKPGLYIINGKKYLK